MNLDEFRDLRVKPNAFCMILDEFRDLRIRPNAFCDFRITDFVIREVTRTATVHKGAGRTCVVLTTTRVSDNH